MNKRAILYLRFSDPKQMGGTTIETQEQISRNSCLVEGFDVVEVTKNEGVSASKTNTERIIDLLDYCKERQSKFEVLVVFKLDRFARSQEQHHWLRRELLKLGIILRSATERIDESPSGKLVEGVLAAVNEYDNEVKRERVKLAMWSRVEHGLWPWGAPTGYMSDPKRPATVKLLPHIIDEKCSQAVLDVFLRYSTGAVTKSDLGKEFSKKKIKNHRGKIVKFPQQSIHNILNNIYYIGLLEHKDGRLIKGLHTPLIDASLYEKCQLVQKRLSNHATRKRLFNHPDFPLRRFVGCGECRKPLTACWSKGEHGGIYAHYFCINKQCSKKGKTIARNLLHNEFAEYLKTIKPQEAFVNYFKEVFIDRYKERQSEIQGDYTRKMEDVANLQKEQEWLIEKGKKGVIPDELLETQLKESAQKIMIAKLSLNETHHEELEIDALLTEGMVFIQTIDLAWYEAPWEAKLKYQRLIFPKGVAYHFNGFSNPELGLPFRLISDIATIQSRDVIRQGLEP